MERCLIIATLRKCNALIFQGHPNNFCCFSVQSRRLNDDVFPGEVPDGCFAVLSVVSQLPVAFLYLLCFSTSVFLLLFISA